MGEGRQEGAHVRRQARDREGPEQGRQGLMDRQVHRAGPEGGGGGGQEELDRRSAGDAGVNANINRASWAKIH